MATSGRSDTGAPLGNYAAVLGIYGFTFAGNNDYFGFSAANPSALGINYAINPFYYMRIGNLDIYAGRLKYALEGGGSWNNTALKNDVNSSYSFSTNIDAARPTITDVRALGFSLRYRGIKKSEFLFFI